MNQGLLVSDAGAVESIAAFAFIAVAIILNVTAVKINLIY
jgi:hypothetical protein